MARSLQNVDSVGYEINQNKSTKDPQFAGVIKAAREMVMHGEEPGLAMNMLRSAGLSHDSAFEIVHDFLKKN